jgi:hypothetical protein
MTLFILIDYKDSGHLGDVMVADIGITKEKLPELIKSYWDALNEATDEEEQNFPNMIQWINDVAKVPCKKMELPVYDYFAQEWW